MPDLSTVLDDWREQYRMRLQVAGCSPLGAEVRLLIAEVATTVRAFSRRLGLNPSVLVRDLQRLDKGKGVKWFHVERILTAAGVAPMNAVGNRSMRGGTPPGSSRRDARCHGGHCGGGTKRCGLWKKFA